jgi:hypothetical protein
MSAFEQIGLQKSANGRPNFLESKASFADAEVGTARFLIQNPHGKATVSRNFAA